MSVYGRWDLIVGEGADGYPSWVELSETGGRFVGRFGSSRPIPNIEVNGSRLTFSLPKQYEGRSTDLEFIGEFAGGNLRGTTTLDGGEATTWVGHPAPVLPKTVPKWGETIDLVHRDWTPRSTNEPNKWTVKDGMLVNTGVGSDLVSVDKFSDFKLVAEYSYPVQSNSGIYLRGRYEFQILDDYEGSPNHVGSSGAIYGFLAPSKNTIKPHGEWNTAEITLLGRYVTVVLNGEPIIDSQEIPGITGGAMDSNEGEPGSFFLQGDHGPVTFRKLSVTETI